MISRFLELLRTRTVLLLLFLVFCEAVYLGFSSGFFPSGREPQQTFLVTLQEDGFSPAALTIPKGARVTFLSALPEEFWPASDLHPTHTIYPEFDPKRPIKPGEQWTFQFQKAGAWQYHDHLHPLFLGEIVVGKAEVSRENAACKDERDGTKRKQCWQAVFDQSLRERGITATLDLLSDLAASDLQFQNDCHAFAHLIGQRAYDLFAEKRDVEVTDKAYYCSYGFYHGFMESLFTRSGDYQEARDFCAYIGKKLGAENQSAESGCYHGIGHGYLDGSDPRTRGDAWAMIQPALKLCEEVGGGSELQQACVSGIFDGLAQAHIFGHYGLNLDVDDPYAICKKLDDPATMGTCYDIIVSLTVTLGDSDFQKAARFVEAIPDTHYAAIAMYSLAGYETAYQFLDRRPPVTYADEIALCRSFQERLRESCLLGLASGFLDNGDPGREEIRAFAFCSDRALSKEEKKSCSESLMRLFWSGVSRERFQSICASLQDADRTYCESFLKS